MRTKSVTFQKKSFNCLVPFRIFLFSSYPSKNLKSPLVQPKYLSLPFFVGVGWGMRLSIVERPLNPNSPPWYPEYFCLFPDFPYIWLNKQQRDY